MTDRSNDAYRKANPLGGPATVFRAIAGRLEAGEDYYAVLEDYGLVHSEMGRSAPEFVPIDFKPWLQSLSPEDTKAIFRRVWDLYDGCPVGEEKPK